MATYHYTALDRGGAEQRGALEADSSRQARQQLRDQGLIPLHIAVQGRGAGRPGPRRLRLRSGELALLTRQLATLLKSGLPLEQALLAMSRQAESPRQRQLLSAVRTQVMEGHSLASALAGHPATFPELFRATVAAGEHSGHLDAVLERLADHAESSHAARQRVQLALLYPALLMLVTLAMVTGLMTLVVPEVVVVFEGQGQTLPLLTRGLMALSAGLVRWGLWLLPLLGLAGWLARRALQRPERALGWHRRLLGLPVVGRLSRGANSARYAATLSTLTRSGVPLVEAMGIAGQVLANTWLRHQAELATQAVSEGSSLYQALEHSGDFPPMMVHMVASGELSGELDTMLERVAAHQQREFDALVATGLGLFEPIILLVMGGAVLLIVLAILLPIFGLNQMI